MMSRLQPGARQIAPTSGIIIGRIDAAGVTRILVLAVEKKRILINNQPTKEREERELGSNKTKGKRVHVITAQCRKE